MKINELLNSKHVHSFIGQLSGSIIAVLSFMVLARGFSKSDFGQWVLYLSLLTFCDMIKAGMVQSAFIKNGSGVDMQSERALHNLGQRLRLIVKNLFYQINFKSLSFPCQR